MQATILLHGDCPVCGYRNQGIRVGTARPGMKRITMQPGALVFTPWECRECGHALGHDLYDHWRLDVETTAKLRAWQERQKAKRKAKAA